MEIPAEILAQWKKLRSHGDGRRLIEKHPGKFGDQDLTRAFKQGKCSDEVFVMMGEFYKEKQDNIDKFMPVNEEKEEGPDG